MADKPLSILGIGAHPDDCEFKAGGVGTLYRQLGHKVCFASVTNGESGHQTMYGEQLAAIRREEAAAAAGIIGMGYEVLEFRDGHLEPTLEARLDIIRLIRRHQPDLIITHRPNDYHPDHRYTSQLVCDASYMVTVPAMAPDTPALSEDPVIVYVSDDFTRPYSFSPSIVVDIEPVLDTVIDMLACHRSQFFDFLPFSFGRADRLPEDPEGQRQFLRDWYIEIFAPLADRFRDLAIATYGEKRGGEVKYIEAFEPCEYGSPLTQESVSKLFPFLPNRAAAFRYNQAEFASDATKPTGTSKMSQAPQQPNDESELINWSAALEATDGDEELLKELVEVFLDEAPADMAKMFRAIEQGDVVALRRSAHTVKGSLRIFECSTASGYAAQIEQIGKSAIQDERALTTDDLSKAKELRETLNEQLSRILPEMEKRIRTT